MQNYSKNINGKVKIQLHRKKLLYYIERGVVFGICHKAFTALLRKFRAFLAKEL